MRIFLLWLLHIHAALAFSLSPLLSPASIFSSIKDIWNDKPLHRMNDRVDLLVNTVVSDKSNIPYSYYNLPFICPASNKVKPVHMSLTEILSGNKLMQSDYNLKFGNDEPCIRLCDRIMNQRNIKRSIELIKNDYIANWVIDGIPGSTTFISDNLQEVKKYYIPGFPLGYIDPKNGDAYINNHIMMVIRYHKESSMGDGNADYSIVGFEIYPKSVSDFHCPGASKDFQHLKLDADSPTQLIPFTYSVYWREESEVDFKSRWKLYIDPSLLDADGNFLTKKEGEGESHSTSTGGSSQRSRMHWVSLINSIVIISFVSLVVGFILLVTFSSNIASSSSSPLDFHDLKVNVKADVDGIVSHAKFAALAQASFSKPTWLPLLAIVSGSGIQLIFTMLGMALLSLLFFGNSNVLSTINANDTKILSATIAVIIVGGFFAGFSAIQLYKLFSNKPNTPTFGVTIVIASLSGSMLISICLIIIVVATSLIFEKDSPRSMKFSTFLLIFSIYILLQLPVSIIGGIISKNINVFVNLIRPKLLPSPPQSQSQSQSKSKSRGSYLRSLFRPATYKALFSSNSPWYLRFPTSLLLLGIAPCGIVFIESRFVYMTLLAQQHSASGVMLGFIIIAALLLSIVMIEIGIVATYLKLSKEKLNSKSHSPFTANSTSQNWQWWTFLNCSLSIFLYLLFTSVYQLLFNQRLARAGSPVLYMVYTTIINGVISVACGALALWSGTAFVYAVVLWSAVKKD
jgi:transmembrane 9 superfamily protein 2/4